MAYQPRFTVEIYHDLAPYIGGVNEYDFFMDADKCVSSWKATTEWTLSEFNGELTPRAPSAAPNSYAHLMCLGAPVRYPENAEPNITPAVGSLDEAIALLKSEQGMDFTVRPEFKRLAAISARVREAFPQAPRLGGFGVEGPLTSAALFRGEGFYTDMFDEPEKCAEYLRLMTESIIACYRQVNAYNGRPEVSPKGMGLADDLASMVPPRMWDDFVLPYWRQYYEGLTTGPSRFLHCEALVPAHLPYIAKAGVTHYQPSVAPALTLENVRANTELPFDWLLYAYRVAVMTDEEIAAWMRESLEARVTNLRTQFGAYAAKEGKLDRIKAFMRIANEFEPGSFKRA